MSSFFNVGNPFSTPVGQRIEQATDACLASENWALNMEICDLINESTDTARDGMKAIRKRLTQNAGKNHTVIMYTLTVLETCVKNCGKTLHLLVANKEFIQELVKLIGPKNDPPAIVQEKVLSLIQAWADAFRNQPDLNGVCQVYHELKVKGIEFPANDLDSLAPIFTPQRSVPVPEQVHTVVPASSPQHINPASIGAIQAPGSPGNIIMPQQQQLMIQQQQLLIQQQQPQQQQIQLLPAILSPEQIAKLQSELDIVSMNMSILGEMLIELKPGQEDPADYKLLTELAQTCKEMQGRIVELIGKVNNDEITAELLRINDELNNMFLRHARYEKNRDPKSIQISGATPSAILGAAMGVPMTSGEGQIDNGKDSLIDLSDEATGLSSQLAGINMVAGGTSTSQLSQINSVSAQAGVVTTNGVTKLPNDPSVTTKEIDEFEMFAQSRNTTVEPIRIGGIKDSPKIDSGIVGGSTTNTLTTKDIPSRESDFDEMAAWLETSEQHDDGTEESLTSKEFDKFLAERAAAAENLPTITTGTSSVTPINNTATQQRHKTNNNKEEDALLL